MSEYHKEISHKEKMHLAKIRKTLPSFLKEFFIGIEYKSSTKTTLAYAYDLGIFFKFLYEEHDTLAGIPSHELKLTALDQVTATDIEEFMNYLSYYVKDTEFSTSSPVTNTNKSKARKLSTIRSMYKYYNKREKITTNAPALVDMPKLNKKPIIKLDVDELANLIDQVETGRNLTTHQLRYHKKTQKRDLALVTLLAGTGIRISECVGINISDIDFKNTGILVTRKGGNQDVIYFGDEVEEALIDYIEERKEIAKISDLDKEKEKNNTNDNTKNSISSIFDKEEPLFLSSQNKRISCRAVQNIVKKYAQHITMKNITPHKLRATFATNLYKETGDIYLVASTLGHSDVNTTTKHYADTDEHQKRSTITKSIKLRKS